MTTLFFDEVLEIEKVGTSEWMSLCNGQWHSSPAAAITTECETLIVESGDNPDDFRAEIADAIDSAI